ncbi:tetratricopeptide repeat protein [Limnohabitans radicicola]|uniref:Tetratricopeptide repeat protein n=1 Tax=Limnohabitans radicicola TaxID=2771427 RepID=A0A927FHB4_9BURK|nr:tetratricopeptide repeat protein [Limnohabitans radicicola]MBD8050628.1 tetratricopeptide repeat protein [Limnohabitans radicicola]
MALHPARPLRHALMAGLIWLCLTPAQADVYDDVQRLIKREEWPQAQALARQHLTNRAQDPQMRLLLSRIQQGLGQNDAATATLLELTQTFPELAEPHNNLAALYAQAGRYDDALASLNRAVQARPDYATALENLGDLHAALAKQAYDRASQAAPTSPRPRAKAQAIGQIQQADSR